MTNEIQVSPFEGGLRGMNFKNLLILVTSLNPSSRREVGSYFELYLFIFFFHFSILFCLFILNYRSIALTNANTHCN
jgi:hypothetical protein